MLLPMPLDAPVMTHRTPRSDLIAMSVCVLYDWGQCNGAAGDVGAWLTETRTDVPVPENGYAYQDMATPTSGSQPLQLEIQSERRHF